MRVLAAGGARVVAVEDPSDPEYRATIEAAGLRWIAIPVDDDGLARRPACRVRRRRRRGHRRPPVPDRGDALGRAADGPRRLGGAARRRDRRGRLRRRVPLRPPADRRAPGAPARPGRLRRLGEQGPRAGPAARLAGGAGATRRADDGRQGGRRHGLGRLRPAGARRPARARRARPSPPPDAADLPRPPRRPARRAGPAPAGSHARPGSRPACTCRPGSRRTSRPPRPGSSPPRTWPGSPSPASRPGGSRPGPAGCSSATA